MVSTQGFRPRPHWWRRVLFGTAPPSLLLLSGVIFIFNKQPTSYNEDTDITRDEGTLGKPRHAIENKHTSYCFKNCGLLHLSTQTFPKNNCKSLDKRRKSKKIDETTRKKVKESVRHLQSRVGQNWSGGPCPTPPVESLCSPHTDN